MQLGFVIDHSRCIGCHACTVACKSENDVPLGSFRTWVKYTERGEFPTVDRSFAVLRCNQCSSAPCVTICPVSALEKRSDGIVDVDPKACIGCKACMHGCPYDALYINPDHGIAEKCHFCAHRTEVGLAPACAVVCPTEAIIPGDFDDPESLVSRMKSEMPLTARKTEAGTSPNVWYREASDAGLDPGLTNISQGHIWSQPPTGERVEAQEWEAMEHQAQARTTYDVPRNLLWGWKITGYLWFKSLAAGIYAAALLILMLSGSVGSGGGLLAGSALASMGALAVTGLLLILDLKRPERFWYLFFLPNWSSWLARRTYIITIFGGLLTVALLTSGLGSGALLAIGIPAALFGLGTASYTGMLFTQAKGRVLWMRRYWWAHLSVQAILSGAALILMAEHIAGPVIPEGAEGALEGLFLASLLTHLVFTLVEGKLAPAGREREYQRAHALVSRGPWALTHWMLGVGVGIVLPLMILLLVPGPLLPAAGAFVLIGLWAEEHVLVTAGQALPIS